MVAVVFHLLHGNLVAASDLTQCAWTLLAHSKQLPLGIIEHQYGGFNILGGFTALKTNELLSTQVAKALLTEYRKVVPRDDSKTQQSYPIDPRSRVEGPVPDFMRAHKDLTLAVLNVNGVHWKWDISSLLLVSQKLQDGFHDHLQPNERSDPQHQVTRQNAGVSLGFFGTVFRSPNDETELYRSEAGETTIFNEGALHQSPDGARARLYLLHWFSRVAED